MMHTLEVTAWNSSQEADLGSGPPEFNSEELADPDNPAHCFHAYVDVANESPPTTDQHPYSTGSFEATNNFSSAVTQLSHGTPTAMATHPSADRSGPGHSFHNAITGEPVEYGADTVKQKEVLASRRRAGKVASCR